MFLKQVVINGFKSFADKTQMVLPKGITCIVGPNGCGKSNIVDSIRWVLGEQSAKALRGGKMQDVIFQGTDKRKPLQFCEVSLLFSDCEKQLGTNFNEVEISRKVSRDGGSEYYINGKASRLKDIQHLFMDTGIGRVSYSFMVQGQIDQILSSNPGERRSIFEEAAGITKYKTQRREALAKLALVDQNLARITDRIEEIGRQIGTLKRQASKALRYKRLSHRLRHLDISLNAKNYAEQQRDVEKDEASLGKISAEFEESKAALAQMEEELAALRSNRAQTSANLESARAAIAELRSQKESAEHGSEFSKLRKKDLFDRIAQIQSEAEALTRQLESLDGRMKGDGETRQMQLDLVYGSGENFELQNAKLAETESELLKAKAELDSAKQDQLVREGALTRNRSNCTTLELDLKSYQVRHASASDALFQAREEMQVLSRKLDEIKYAAESANERLASSESDILSASKKVDETRGRYRDCQAQIQNMDRALAGKAARLSLLNDFQKRMEGFSDGVKAIMQGKIADVLPPSETKIISQSIDVAEEWTAAFESMMGAAIDAVALPDPEKLPAIIEAFRENRMGKACFQTKGAEFPVPQDLPEGVYRAEDFVRADRDDESLKALVKNLVGGCYFCEDICAFRRYASSNPNFAFALAVSRDRSVLDSRGMLYVSNGENKDTESSFLLRNREIKRLNDETAKDNAELTRLNEQAMSIQAELDLAESEAENAKAAAAEIKRELTRIDAQTKAEEANISQKRSDAEKLQRLLDEMENSRYEAQTKLDAARQAMEEAEAEIEGGKIRIAELEQKISSLQSEKEQKFSALSAAKLDLAEKKSALESIEKGISAVKLQRQETLDQLSRRAQEKASTETLISSLEAEAQSLAQKAQSISAELENSAKAADSLREKLALEEKQISEFEEALNVLRTRQNAMAMSKNEIEVRLASMKSRLSFISERMLADYETDIASTDWKRELWLADEQFEIKLNLDELEDGEISAKPKAPRGEPTQEDFDKMDSADFAAIENEAKELRDKISAMGSVNLVAIEEYAELKERFDFLNSQSSDLWKSKNELVSAIDEINEKSQKLFSETFEQIRKNFEFTFKKIFGGGAADLRLVESEDMLDSGIEIVARPPGTVLKSLSLLSGGQRTMTAVSLLFAIYMVKPSPFCVLDELDAPLDDANIGRYTDILKEFTKYSQFLVISHSKKTVSAADTIYGVTMQERGVTKLISMRFNPESNDTESGEISDEI
ncbi:MAG: chromosome segregation protein SMC [Opitutales bacterium]|nr:chromosome segregation protein SMC [Opitutales bacterium]